jgi:perosamine synthetase
MVGALPVFVDVDPDTFQIDVAKTEAAITPATRAIMPVHLYGSACDMVGIMALAEKHGLKVLEDAAQGIGVRTSLGHVGAIGDIGTFSFFADKTITTGEGGFVVTNDAKLYEKLRYLRNQGRLDRGSFVHPEIGYNFRMTDMQAAMGLVQLGKLDEIVRRKTRNLALYEEGLAGLEQGRLIGRHADTNNVPFRCVLLADRVQELSAWLAERRVQPRSFFYPLRKQPAFAGVCPPPDEAEWNSDVGFARGICLPIHPQLSEDDIAYICEAIRAFYA